MTTIADLQAVEYSGECAGCGWMMQCEIGRLDPESSRVYCSEECWTYSKDARTAEATIRTPSEITDQEILDAIERIPRRSLTTVYGALVPAEVQETWNNIMVDGGDDWPAEVEAWDQGSEQAAELRQRIVRLAGWPADTPEYDDEV